MKVVVDILFGGIFDVVVGWRERYCCLEDNVIFVDDMIFLLLAVIMLNMLTMIDIDYRRLHPQGKCGVFNLGIMAAFSLFPFFVNVDVGFCIPTESAQSLTVAL